MKLTRGVPQGTHGYSLAGYLKRDDAREESAQRRRDDRVPASGNALVGMPKWERPKWERAYVGRRDDRVPNSVRNQNVALSITAEQQKSPAPMAYSDSTATHGYSRRTRTVRLPMGPLCALDEDRQR